MIMVLWVLAVLTMIGTFFAVEARIARNLGTQAWDDLQARMAAYSLLKILPGRLIPPPEEEEEGVEEFEEARFVVDGRKYKLRLGGKDIIFSLEEENGKLDLNKAEENQIRELIRSIFSSEEDDLIKADTIVDSILDWRDSDKLVRLNGAEDAAYEDKKPPYRPANGPFNFIEELLLVNGIDSGMFWGPLEYIAPSDGYDQTENSWQGGLIDLFTVYSGSKNVIKDYAPLPIQEIMEDDGTQQTKKPQKIRLILTSGSKKIFVFWETGNGRGSNKILHWISGFIYDKGKKQKWAENK